MFMVKKQDIFISVTIHFSNILNICVVFLHILHPFWTLIKNELPFAGKMIPICFHHQNHINVIIINEGKIMALVKCLTNSIEFTITTITLLKVSIVCPNFRQRISNFRYCFLQFLNKIPIDLYTIRHNVIFKL